MPENAAPENSAPQSAALDSAPVSVAPRLAVRHVQMMRAILAAIAALMITFSSDHSASFGLAVFSGFAITTALVLGFAAWMAYPSGRRWPIATIAVVSALAGMIGGIPPWRTTPAFFAIVISWAAITGVVELLGGWRDRRNMALDEVVDPQRASENRDATVVGVFGLALAFGVALVPAGYSLDYFIDDAHRWFTLTGTTIAVGILGAYAAIVAVYLGIAALSPRRPAHASGPAPDGSRVESPGDASAQQSTPPGESA